MTDEMSSEDFKALHEPKRKSKYSNVKCEEDGYRFDSQAERRRYRELKHLVAAGAIEGLVLQPPFPLEVNGQKIATYRADFLYFDRERGQAVVEDVKGALTPVYRLKKKLVKAIHGVEIEEVAA